MAQRDDDYYTQISNDIKGAREMYENMKARDGDTAYATGYWLGALRALSNARADLPFYLPVSHAACVNNMDKA